MILTVASYKGGVGKTTTAIHLAAYLQSLAPTLLLDNDPTRSALNWIGRGDGMTFRSAPGEHAAKLARHYEHMVIDTAQKPTGEDLKDAAGGCDLLVIPSGTAPQDLDGLGQTIQALQQLGAKNFRVLLTQVRPDQVKAAVELRETLASMKAPVFTTEIPNLKAFETASGQGQTVDQVHDRQSARAWRSYEAAGREITA